MSVLIKLPSGGVDLSFITAGAAQILNGFIGADANGNPVPGAYAPTIVSIPSSSWTISPKKSSDYHPYVTIPFGIAADFYIVGFKMGRKNSSVSSVTDVCHCVHSPTYATNFCDGLDTWTKSFNASTNELTITSGDIILANYDPSFKWGTAYAIKL
jgi:hypothetical protein